MSQSSKKQREFRWLRLCQEKCLVFPQGEPLSYEDERPDFRFAQGSLGIEITDYIQDQDKRGSLVRELEMIQERIVKEAQTSFENERNEQIQVSVFWVSNVKPTKSDRKMLVHGIVQTVTRLISQGRDCWWPDWSRPDEGALGKHIGQIGIYCLKRSKSFWGCDEAGPLGGDVNRVQAALREKECKVAEYRKRCRNIWLVIVADGQHISSAFSPNAV